MKSLLKFTGKGCGNCKAMSSLLDKVLVDFPKIEVVEYDVGEHVDVARVHKVTTLPTLVLIDKRKQTILGTLAGLKPASVTREFLKGGST